MVIDRLAKRYSFFMVVVFCYIESLKSIAYAWVLVLCIVQS